MIYGQYTTRGDHTNFTSPLKRLKVKFVTTLGASDTAAVGILNENLISLIHKNKSQLL